MTYEYETTALCMKFVFVFLSFLLRLQCIYSLFLQSHGTEPIVERKHGQPVADTEKEESDVAESESNNDLLKQAFYLDHDLY